MENVYEYVRDLKPQLERVQLHVTKHEKATSFKNKYVCLNEEQLQSLIDYTPRRSNELKARAFFLLCFYLYGAAIIDVVFLDKGAYNKDYLSIKRHSSELTVRVPLSSQLNAYIAKFFSRDANSPYLFCFLDGETDESRKYKKYRDVARTVNRGLADIAVKLNFPTPFTIRSARYTFAYLIRNAGNSIETIMQVLGATSIWNIKKLMSHLPA